MGRWRGKRQGLHRGHEETYGSDGYIYCPDGDDGFTDMRAHMLNCTKFYLLNICNFFKSIIPQQKKTTLHVKKSDLSKCFELI